jgi:integrase
VRNEDQTRLCWNLTKFSVCWLNSKTPVRVMALLDVTTGLRRSELFALKWKDIDFSNLQIDIKR